MNRSRKDITLMFTMGALLLFAVFNFVFKPQRNDLASARSDLQQVEQSLSDAELTLQAPAVTTPDQPAASASAVPRDPAVATLLRQLSSVADDTDVTLAAISPTPLDENPTGPGGSLQVSITASGAHAAVLAFVEQLRDMERLTVVEKIGIDSQPATGEFVQVDQVQLSVRVFTLRPPATVPADVPTSTSP